MRIEVITQLHKIGTGHPGGSLSVCEILVSLYFEKARVDARHPKDISRDRIILSKGHAAPMLYRILAEKGYFDVSDYNTLRQLGSHLQGHPNALDTPGIEISTGPLGIGFSAALGVALAIRLEKASENAYVYAILGDGELNEGIVWETAMAAAKFKADHLIAIIDRNQVQLDGTSDEIMPLFDLGAKWKAFGWRVYECDGHDISDICAAIDRAAAGSGRPAMIVANTVKGKGVSYMEGNHVWHGNPIGDQDYEQAMRELS